MKIIKTELDDKLVIGIVFDNQDDIESVRAWCGNSEVGKIIKASKTPTAPEEQTRELITKITRILNPLSKLLK